MPLGRKIINKGSRRVLPAEKPGLDKSTARKKTNNNVNVSAKSKKKKTAGYVKPNIKPSGSTSGLKPMSAPKMDKAGRKKLRMERRAAKAQLKTTRQDRLGAQAKKLGDKAKTWEGTKKGGRLARRAQRKKERAAGTRKSAVGTALKGAGLGLARGLARVGGYGGKFKKGMAAQKRQKPGANKAAGRAFQGSFSNMAKSKKPSLKGVASKLPKFGG